MPVLTEGFAVVRRSAAIGREWIATDELGLVAEDARRKAENCDKLIPQWAKQNPVVRIARVEIREVPA